MKITTLIKKVAAIEKLGTRVASFTYNGKPRNVIIGADVGDGPNMIGRSLRKTKGGNYLLVPRVMNDAEKVKSFRLDRISDFRCSSVNNIK